LIAVTRSPERGRALDHRAEDRERDLVCAVAVRLLVLPQPRAVADHVERDRVAVLDVGDERPPVAAEQRELEARAAPDLGRHHGEQQGVARAAFEHAVEQEAVDAGRRRHRGELRHHLAECPEALGRGSRVLREAASASSACSTGARSS
jgi:hypothetical protein